MGGKEKVIKGLSVQSLVTAAMGILELVYFSVMSRLLTKTDFGYFASIVAVIAIAYSISEAGLGAAIIQKKDSSKEHVSTAFSLAVISGTLCSIVLFLIAPFLSNLISDGGISVALRIMSCILLINSLNSIANGLLARKLNFKKIGILQIGSYSISIVVAIIMAYNGYGLYALVVNALLYPTLLCISYFSLGVKLPEFAIHREHVKSILSFGGWLTASVIVNNIAHQVDKLMVPRLLSVQALGAYNRPAGFVSTISSKINSIFDTVLFPILSKYQDDMPSVRNIYYRATDLLNTFSVLLASIFIFNAKLIIEIFFGEEWLNITLVLQTIAISVIFNINGRLVDCFFRSLKLVRASFYIRFTILAITIICTWAGAKFGIEGIAIGLVVSNVTGIIIKVIYLCSNIGIDTIRIFKYWFFAWKLLLPYIVSYLLFYQIFDSSLWHNVLYACIFTVIAAGQYIFFPRYIGEEYFKTVYPYITKKLGIKK